MKRAYPPSLRRGPWAAGFIRCTYTAFGLTAFLAYRAWAVACLVPALWGDVAPCWLSLIEAAYWEEWATLVWDGED